MRRDQESRRAEAGTLERPELAPAEHPSFSVLDRVARRASSSGERQQVVRHLLAGCPGCCARVRTLQRSLRPRPDELDAAIDRAFSRVQELVATVATARERLARLLALPAEQQLAAAITDEYCDAALCRLLLEETEEVMATSPVRGLQLGRIAAAMARQLAAHNPYRFDDLRDEARQRLTRGMRVLTRQRQEAARPAAESAGPC